MVDNPHSNQDLEVLRIEAEREHRREEIKLRREELAQRAAEANADVKFKEDELAVKATEAEASKKSRFTGIATAGIAGTASLLAAGLTAYLGGFFSLETQRQRGDAELVVQQRKNDGELALQKQRNDAESTIKELDRRFQLLLKATENRTREDAAANLLFFVDIGYLPDPEAKIRAKAERKEVPVFTSGATNPTLSETASQFGLNNTIPKEAEEAFRYLREKVVDPVEKHFRKPIQMISGYRSEELNKKLGGSPTSAHLRGEAIDFSIDGVSASEIACWIRENLDYDDLAIEPSTSAPGQWVHVALKKSGNRKVERGLSCQ